MAYAHSPKLTLDDATGNFDNEPSARACADLLRTAMSYWTDEMIGEDEFKTIVERVAEWLRAD